MIFAGLTRPTPTFTIPTIPTKIIPAEAAGGILAATNSANDLAKSLETTIAKVNTTLDAVNNGVLE